MTGRAGSRWASSSLSVRPWSPPRRRCSSGSCSARLADCEREEAKYIMDAMKNRTSSFVIAAVAALGIAWAVQAQTPDGKIDVCHKGRAISVAAEALAAHLAHGDAIGNCQSERIY